MARITCLLGVSPFYPKITPSDVMVIGFTLRSKLPLQLRNLSRFAAAIPLASVV